MDLNDRPAPGTETPGAKFKIFVPMVKAMRDETSGDLFLSGIASSTIKDLHGDRMEETALDDMLRAAQNNLTIFLNHHYDVPEDVAGSVKAASLERSPDGVVDLRFDRIRMNRKNSRVVESFESIEDGTKLGLSIGAMIPEGGAHYDKKSGGWTIEHIELLETSLVGVPANPRSWVDYAVKAMSGHYPDQFANVIKRSGIEGLSKDIRPWILEGDNSDVDVEGIDPLSVHLSADTSQAEAMLDQAIAAVEELDVVDKKPTTHIHPHAHEHEHEHSHGWEGATETVHTHPHAHTHSHDHGPDHEHDDTMNDYQHDHYHNGATEDEHAHKDADSVISREGIPDTACGFIGDGVLCSFDKAHEGRHSFEDDEGNIVARVGPDATPLEPVVTAQGAPESIPETVVAEGAETVITGEDFGEALKLLQPGLVTSLQTGTDLIKALTSELSTTRSALAAAETSRDEAVEMADRIIRETSDILVKLSAVPVGRRAVVKQVNEQFDHLAGIYSEEALSLLRSK